MKILVVMPVNEKHKTLLKSTCADAEWIFDTNTEIAKKVISEVDIIIGNIDPAILPMASNLKWLQLNSAGTDGYTSGALAAGVALTNATGSYGIAISEYMIGSLLFLMKKFAIYSKDNDKHEWTDHGPVTGIYGSNTLVVGCGDIGCEFAKRMSAMGSHVCGIRRNPSDVPVYMDSMYQMDVLHECLAHADIVATSLPGTKETYHVFGKNEFAAMKEGAYFINVGRGGAVDSNALADALNSGHLAGAVIDVTEPEPLPGDHPLWNAKNIFITPHISGGYHMQETHDRIIRIAAENLERFLNGEKMYNLVDFETGYRKDRESSGVKKM